MHIAVIGTGYVGLVTGACFAVFGVDVICVDSDAEKIDRLISVEMPIHEPGLQRPVSKNSQAGRLKFTTDVRTAVEQALGDLFSCRNPSEGWIAGPSFVEAAANSVADRERL